MKNFALKIFQDKSLFAKVLLIGSLIFVLSASFALAQFSRQTGDDGWGWGYGYGYGEGFGWDAGQYAGYRAAGEPNGGHPNPAIYDYGFGYGYIAAGTDYNEAEDYYEVDFNDMASLVLSGVMEVDGSDAEDTSEITFTKEVRFMQGSIEVQIPEGTVITDSDGDSFNSTLLDAADAENDVDEDNIGAQANLQGAVEFGISGITLYFSQPITVTIPVDSSLNGDTINISRSPDGGTTWESTGLTTASTDTCTNGIGSDPADTAVVSGGQVIIYTCRASTFATYTESAIGGGMGGGGNYLDNASNNGTLSVTATGGIVSLTLQNGNYVKVEIPTGAVSQTTKFTIKEVTATNLPSAETGYFIIDNATYEITALDQNDMAVTQFNKPLTLKFSYVDKNLSDKGLNEFSNVVSYWKTETKQWVQLPTTISLVGNTATASIDHLTTFALMAKKDGAVITTPIVTSDEIITETVQSSIPVRASKTNLDSERSAIKFYVGLTKSLPAGNKWTVIHFVAYGTAETNGNTAKNREDIIREYYETYGKVPSLGAEWNDLAKILTSKTPTEKSVKAEAKAITEFKKAFKRSPVLTNANDLAAVNYIAYKIRILNRSLVAEQNAINKFRGIYRVFPGTSTHWSIIRALAYAGVK